MHNEKPKILLVKHYTYIIYLTTISNGSHELNTEQPISVIEMPATVIHLMILF